MESLMKDESKFEGSKDLALKIFIEVVLARGRKNSENSKRLFEQFSSVIFPVLSKSSEKQLEFLKAVEYVWQKDQAKMSAMLMKSYQSRLVSPNSLLAFLLTDFATGKIR